MKLLTDEERETLLAPDPPMEIDDNDEEDFTIEEELVLETLTQDQRLRSLVVDDGEWTQRKWVNTEWGEKALRVDAIVRQMGGGR